ncbi:D-proline reductase, PrdA proprotein [Aedoeadaptatus nemausensis]|uniref:D-proline reductase, PrdA proprotein n=1 Tax=Aedoeadaptatus nemausensis TaxID=2582829 RepID=A0A6V6Y6R3_9FIRM|nr:D-proline reductase (dithiol) proprotein PrdA [Peptoniphilus nemausensis]CAC9935425.1 D-proline reductase, PrdA proprotein [Peptoniphilus nemausensis]
MSITKETAMQHLNDPAVTCCRFEAGEVVEPSILEDPAIFGDLEDTGLLEITDETLTIGQVIGAKLKKTVDSLTPLTKDLVEDLPEVPFGEEPAEEEAPAAEAAAPVAEAAAPAAEAPSVAGYANIKIAKGENIEISFPVVGGSGVGAGAQAAAAAAGAQAPAELAKDEFIEGETHEIRNLRKDYYTIEKIERGPETKIEGTTLYIREGIEQEVIDSQELVKDFKIDIITPDRYDEYSETIMDVQPIATKEEGELGTGVTRVIDGAIMMLTGTDEGGVQIGEFGSSEGEMDRNIMFGRPGSPDEGEMFIKCQVTIQAKTNMERRGPMSAHHAADHMVDEIRQALKQLEAEPVRSEEFSHVRKDGRKKVLIIKEIMGQGAMHDNLLLPIEPCGWLGGHPNVDLGNLPIMLSPLEILDGGVHALTCIGPASKEMSRHYFREPLVLEALADDEIDLIGVMLVGSPQANTEKFYVSKRLGMTVEAINPDGVIITTEGFGNNHIDFGSHHEQVGLRGIPVVGMSFCAVQGALVTGNEYMVAMVDNNKSRQGIENEILENNTLCEEDAIRALAMLKNQMAGEEVKAPERKWNPNVKLNNVDLIKEQTGREFDLVENETILKMSKKRREIYEKDEAGEE